MYDEKKTRGGRSSELRVKVSYCDPPPPQDSLGKTENHTPHLTEVEKNNGTTRQQRCTAGCVYLDLHQQGCKGCTAYIVHFHVRRA